MKFEIKKKILQPIIKRLKKRGLGTAIFFISLFLLNVALFTDIVTLKNDGLLRITFLNVGQGDASLITLPGGAQIMIDGGPNPRDALQELSKVLSPFDRTIDLITSSHPQQDHIGGLPEVIRRYRTSAYISNGEKNTIGVYETLIETLQKENVPNIILSRGDRIRYRDSIIEVLNPPKKLGEDLNENSIVLLLKSASTTALFTGDIGAKTEKQILQYLEVGLPDIDILKVAHHGSKYSSSKEFLKALTPKIAVIQVGEKNRFGHPAKETINRLKNVNTKILRNDEDNTITLISNGETIKIVK
ncbi:MAG: ComEC/Rec2 family competence protein [Nanoarchaeota archaeon]|nr:ComEC/Rec2 family competence protein [Nanoarchaeota archaeon]